jgi:hypothetical protein
MLTLKVKPDAGIVTNAVVNIWVRAVADRATVKGAPGPKNDPRGFSIERPKAKTGARRLRFLEAQPRGGERGDQQNA